MGAIPGSSCGILNLSTNYFFIVNPTFVSWSLMKDWLHVEGVFAVFLAPALRHCFEWLHLFPVFRCHSISYLGCRI